ncbi:SRPBCC family protein [Aquihabitans sp. G128]|uniref:SRPBCC family protein n=1 Tax=Aquihabitans sp. G128 TaxID=2849779 RepID=UPI001C23C0BF|nr:SRPBCC family protein [Aquihabitans sp. G128]QXC62237.1 SRPBCC family protein [Aquihabitans sp. G128]
MATVHHTIALPVSAVYGALTTPETYPHWLVGCRDIRSVDAAWPAPGSKFHHRVGLVGPITLADNTKVLERVDDEVLSLEVRARPFGRGRATFTLAAGTDPSSTVVELDEVPIGLLAPTKPLADPLISRRNERSLSNLAAYLERGESQADTPG